MNGYHAHGSTENRLISASISSSTRTSPTEIDAVIDSFVIGPGIDQQVVTSLEHGLKLGDGLLGFHITKPKQPGPATRSSTRDSAAQHRLVAGEMNQAQFTFNDPSANAATCAGIGTAMRVHPSLLVPDPTRSLSDGEISSARRDE